VKIMIKRAVVIDVGIEVHRIRGGIDGGRTRDSYNWSNVAKVGGNQLARNSVIPSEGLIKLVYQSGLADKPSASKA